MGDAVVSPTEFGGQALALFDCDLTAVCCSGLVLGFRIRIIFGLRLTPHHSARMAVAVVGRAIFFS